MSEPPFREIPGIRLGTAAAGIKRGGRDDLLVIEAAPDSVCAGVFTRNAFCAAPVTVAREHLLHDPRWLLVNSGNANAGTGARGLADVRTTCAALAALTGGDERQILPFSTGVIGEYLPVEKIMRALPQAVQALTESGWEAAAQAIMTTDTRPKLASRRLAVAGTQLCITGIAKGAGMIHPNMATLLAFLATDARIDPVTLQSCLSAAVEETFNCISVDGDTSTNDACLLIASGKSATPPIVPGSDAHRLFARTLRDVCGELAEAIIRDGEGATKLIRIVVEQARHPEEALRVARNIAHSPLVKTAFFASDPNWGRILAAVGRADCPHLDISRVSIHLDDVAIVERGERAASYTEEAGRRVMRQDEITVRVALGRGTAARTFLSCDLSYDYVRINAEYRT